MKQVLIDENLPPRLVEVWKLHGIRSEHVLDLGLTGGQDRDIWTQALFGNAAIATKDVDFLDLAPVRCEYQIAMVNSCSSRGRRLDS